MAKKDDIKANEETIKEAVEQIENFNKPKAPNPEEKVLIEIPISEQEQDDWFCCINGETFQIQRGVPVMVPRKVKEVYDNQKRMTEQSIMRSRALQQKLIDKERNLAFR